MRSRNRKNVYVLKKITLYLFFFLTFNKEKKNRKGVRERCVGNKISYAYTTYDANNE